MVPGSPSGCTSPEPGRCSGATSNRSFQVSWGSTTSECPRSARHKQHSRGSTGSPRSAGGTTGPSVGGYSNGPFEKCSSQESLTSRSVSDGPTTVGRRIGPVPPSRSSCRRSTGATTITPVTSRRSSRPFMIPAMFEWAARHSSTSSVRSRFPTYRPSSRGGRSSPTSQGYRGSTSSASGAARRSRRTRLRGRRSTRWWWRASSPPGTDGRFGCASSIGCATARFGCRPMHTPRSRPELVPGCPTSYPCVLTNWDDTPRWGRRGYVLVDPDADDLSEHVRTAVRLVADRAPDERIAFVKSWNEWAEGNHLEPDRRHGRRRLEAVLAGLCDSPGGST